VLVNENFDGNVSILLDQAVVAQANS
jgi:hypothetical protein